MDGGVVSDTTTLKAGHDAWLLALSVAVHMTVVLPIENKLPDTTIEPEVVVQALTDIPELSTALKFHVIAVAGMLPLVGVAVMGLFVLNGGQLSVGGVESILVIENEQFDILFALLVAEHPM
jgi:hypothetical protein